MFKHFWSSIFAGALLTVGLAAPAHALVGRAWVSGHGADAAGCGAPTNPCRTFQFVLSNILAPGGEIDVLDPAGYGPMTINFAVNIINKAALAGVIGPSGGTAITINAGTTDFVNLQGLVIEGQGSATTGIQVNSAGSVSLSGSEVFGFTGAGINFTPNNGSGGSSSLTISSTGVYDNQSDDVVIAPQGGTQGRAVLKDKCSIGGAPVGVLSDGSAAAFVHTTITDCIVSNISGPAVEANGPSSAIVNVMVDRANISNTDIALESSGSNARVAVTGSTIAHSTTPTLSSSSGALYSFGNNTFFYVTTQPSFTITEQLK